MPVFKETLDNVLGFVFIKDLIQRGPTLGHDGPITPLIRPAHFVPETKRVPGSAEGVPAQARCRARSSSTSTAAPPAW